MAQELLRERPRYVKRRIGAEGDIPDPARHDEAPRYLGRSSRRGCFSGEPGLRRAVADRRLDAPRSVRRRDMPPRHRLPTRKRRADPDSGAQRRCVGWAPVAGGGSAARGAGMVRPRRAVDSRRGGGPGLRRDRSAAPDRRPRPRHPAGLFKRERPALADGGGSEQVPVARARSAACGVPLGLRPPIRWDRRPRAKSTAGERSGEFDPIPVRPVAGGRFASGQAGRGQTDVAT